VSGEPAKIDAVSIERATACSKARIDYVEETHHKYEKEWGRTGWNLDEDDAFIQRRKRASECLACFEEPRQHAGDGKRPCGVCGKEDVFFGSVLCLLCGLENRLCRRCGADVDLKRRRKPRPFQEKTT
jgi:hypothetical protein